MKIIKTELIVKMKTIVGPWGMFGMVRPGREGGTKLSRSGQCRRSGERGADQMYKVFQGGWKD